MKMQTMLWIIVALSFTTAAYAQDSRTNLEMPQPASALSKKGIKAENRKLQKAVIRALASAKGLNSANVVVVARQGDVVLRGSVTDASQSQIATAVTGSVAGVIVVKNELLIRPE
jgi:hyperosmotically inducible protein